MGTVKAIGGFLVVILVAFSLFQVVPPLLANYNFQDDLRQVAMMDGAAFQKTDDDVRNVDRHMRHRSEHRFSLHATWYRRATAQFPPRLGRCDAACPRMNGTAPGYDPSL